MLLSMGAATFPKDGEDFDELLHWARARVAGAARLAAAPAPPRRPRPGAPSGSWRTCCSPSAARLPDSSPSARLAADARASSRRRSARRRARSAATRARAGSSTSARRGGSPRRRSRRRCRPATPRRAPATRAVHVYLLGPRGARRRARSHPLVTEVYLDGDERLRRATSSCSSSPSTPRTALLAGPDGRMFHTSDVPLVDALVSKLQTLYDLQPI